MVSPLSVWYCIISDKRSDLSLSVFLSEIIIRLFFINECSSIIIDGMTDLTDLHQSKRPIVSKVL